MMIMIVTIIISMNIDIVIIIIVQVARVAAMLKEVDPGRSYRLGCAKPFLGDHTNPPHPHKSDLNQFIKYKLR